MVYLNTAAVALQIVCTMSQGPAHTIAKGCCQLPCLALWVVLVIEPAVTPVAGLVAAAHRGAAAVLE